MFGTFGEDVSPFRLSSLKENLINIALSNPSTSDLTLLAFPKTFFDNLGMTPQNRQLVEEYFKQPELEEQDEMIQDIFSENDNWLKKARRSEEKGVTEEDVDPKELEMGIEIEREHTDNDDAAKLIALDHLAELPDYYTRLKKMEEEGEKEQAKG